MTCWYLINCCDTHINLLTILLSQNKFWSTMKPKHSFPLKAFASYELLACIYSNSVGASPALLNFSFLFLPVCFSHCWNCAMTVSKNHTRQAGKRAIVVGSAFFLCGQNRANTLMITHSPSSVFHLCTVPDPQRWGNRQDWVNPYDELQSPQSPHWLLFSVCSGLELASSYSEAWLEPAVLSSQGTSEDCSSLLSVGIPKCVCVCW